MLGRFVTAVAFIVGTSFAATAQGDRGDVVDQIHERITSKFPEYVKDQRVKALSGCINWENSAPNIIDVRHLVFFYTEEGNFLPSALMKAAIDNCSEQRKKNNSNCECEPISKNGQSALKVPDSFIK